MQCNAEQGFFNYTVEHDMSLQVLAVQLGYHPMILRQVNGKLGSYLHKGQLLKLPYRRCPPAIFYQVFPGQTFLGICDGLGLLPQQILARNGFLPHGKLKAGQVLLLPNDSAAYAKAKCTTVEAGNETAAQRLYRNKLSADLFLLLNPQYADIRLQPGQIFHTINWAND